MIYKWRFENYFPVAAQEAGKELERIDKKYDGLLPEYIISESKSTLAVLHNCFEWDNLVAAKKYREEQARKLIRDLVVIKIERIVESKERMASIEILKSKEAIEKAGKSTQIAEAVVPVRAFVNVIDRDNRRWVSMNTACSNVKYMEQLQRQALADLVSFKQKYINLKILQEVFDTIDRIVGSINDEEIKEEKEEGFSFSGRTEDGKKSIFARRTG